MNLNAVVKGLLGVLISVSLSACESEDPSVKKQGQVNKNTPDPPPEKLRASPGKPSIWSGKLGGIDLSALKRGEKRLALRLESYEPPDASTGELIVSISHSDPALCQELWRIGVHPNQAISPGSGAPSFLLPQKDFSDFLEKGKLRLEVSFPASNKDADGGFAKFDILLVDQKVE